MIAGKHQNNPLSRIFRLSVFQTFSIFHRMTWIEYTALSVTSLIFLIGLATSLLPGVPGSLIVWSGVTIHKFWMGDASVSWNIVIMTGIIMLVGQIADFGMGVWGARKFGATWKGAVGALIELDDDKPAAKIVWEGNTKSALYSLTPRRS